jgi:lysophospholipase L1-like esterase
MNKKRVACVGDSLTDGYYNQGRSWHPYHTQWDTQEYEVTNLGVSGALVSRKAHNLWLGSTVLSIQAESVRYDSLVFMAGTNDLGHRVDLSVITKAWDLLADALSQYGEELVVCTVPNTATTNPQREALNAFIRNWAQTTPGVVLCDVAAQIPYSKALYDDNLHFNPRGYDRLGALIYDCL